MERRRFLGLLGAIVATSPSAPQPDETFGYLTPDIVIARGYDNATVRVFLNGRELYPYVQKIAACDDREGWVEFFARDWSGNYYRDPQHPDRIARERRYGRVRVEMQRYFKRSTPGVPA
jgi:hypothetical protein